METLYGENSIKYIRVILSDSQQPTTPVCLLINHHGCCERVRFYVKVLL